MDHFKTRELPSEEENQKAHKLLRARAEPAPDIPFEVGLANLQRLQREIDERLTRDKMNSWKQREIARRRTNTSGVTLRR